MLRRSPYLMLINLGQHRGVGVRYLRGEGSPKNGDRMLPTAARHVSQRQQLRQARFDALRVILPAGIYPARQDPRHEIIDLSWSRSGVESAAVCHHMEFVTWYRHVIRTRGVRSAR